MAPQQYFLPSTSAEYKNKSLEGRRKAFFFSKATQMAPTTQNWPTNRLSQNIAPPHFAPSPAELPLSPPVHSKPLLPTKIHFLLPILLIFTALTISPISGQTTGKCYSFAPGLSIVGADYRRDFGLSRRQCADVCKTDVCCMAFEWRRAGGQCTLKSRSLNGTVVQMPAAPQEEEEIGGKADEGQKAANQAATGDVFFALCLDYGDSERDRFWDHELGGLVVASVGSVGREKCAQFCTEFNANGGTVEKRSAATAAGMELEESNETRGFFAGHHGGRRGKRPSRSAKSANTPSAVIYSWRTMDPTDMEAPTGECQCISVLQHIRLSFGSFAGFLI